MERKVDTEINIQDAITDSGTVTMVDGQTKGPRGRTVTLQATAAPGYVFDGWEIEKSPVRLRIFIAPAVGLYQTLDSVCDPTVTQEYTNQTKVTTLYTDGTLLYTDPEGVYQASKGFWSVFGGRGYLIYDGTILPVTQTCPTPQQQPIGVGGGGTNLFRVSSRDGQIIDAGYIDGQNVIYDPNNTLTGPGGLGGPAMT